MFTGIIEHCGILRGSQGQGPGRRLDIDIGPLAADCRIGDSIAVNGCCLTATAIDGSLITCDVSGESLDRTTIGSWQVGRRLNCERALALGDRLGGHIVSGHVDGVGRLQERRPQGTSWRFTFLLPENGRVRVVEKGSITIDGISLTCFACRGRRFSVTVIPHTLTSTTLADHQPGQAVNLEEDLIARWVEKLLPERA